MELKFNTVLVTGSAGFIGFHLAQRLLNEGFRVIGIDNLSTYYDVNLKKGRLKKLIPYPDFDFFKTDISDSASLEDVFRKNKFDIVVNLAAQAGVRYSLKNPISYVESNVVGFVNLLECCRHYKIKHLVFASSSSVYGANTKMPFSTQHKVDHPISLYAATKKSNELLAHSYSHLYDMACTGLRFFTVYGPWGRPDMALFLFTKAMLEKRPIQVFNHGRMKRDFTYIDDIIEGVVRIMRKIPEPDPLWSGDDPNAGTSYVRYRIYNIGNNNPIELGNFIAVIENALGIEAKKEYHGMQSGDVPETYADINDLMEAVDFKPKTSIKTGIARFIDWYKDFYGF